MLGDQVGRVLGDELVAPHGLDQRIFPFVQPAGQAVEGRGQRTDLAAGVLVVATQRGQPLLGIGVPRQVASERHERLHQEPGQKPDRYDHDHAGDEKERDEAPDELVDRGEGLVLRVDGCNDPVRRRHALVGDECFAPIRVQRWLGTLESRSRQARPIQMHDELAVGADDEDVPGLADHRLGDIAEQSRIGEADAARQNRDEAAILREHGCGHHQHHIPVADVGEERFRNDRSLGADGVADVRPPRRVVAAAVWSVGALGKEDALVGEQER